MRRLICLAVSLVILLSLSAFSAGAAQNTEYYLSMSGEGVKDGAQVFTCVVSPSFNRSAAYNFSATLRQSGTRYLLHIEANGTTSNDMIHSQAQDFDLGSEENVWTFVYVEDPAGSDYVSIKNGTTGENETLLFGGSEYVVYIRDGSFTPGTILSTSLPQPETTEPETEEASSEPEVTQYVPTKEKNSTGNGMKALGIIMIILALAAFGYFIYSRFLAQKDVPVTDKIGRVIFDTFSRENGKKPKQQAPNESRESFDDLKVGPVREISDSTPISYD